MPPTPPLRAVADPAVPKNPPPAKPLRAWHYVLLSLPFLGLLIPRLYAQAKPEIFGIPFFYTYQFLWIPLSSALTATVYWSIRR
jgi:hypothetical protein